MQNYVSQATYNGKNLLSASTSGTAVSFVADVTGTTLTLQTTSDLASAVSTFSSLFTTNYTTASNYGSAIRSEEHTSELQSLMSTSYAVSCLIHIIITTNSSHTNNS